MKKTRNLKGLTLIEVIVALAIFGIILIAFLNMFSFAMIGLYRAGDKSAATSLVQSDFENQLALGEAYYSDVMKLNFAGKIIEISGGFVDTTKSSGLSSSRIVGFIPFIPTIIIDPLLSVEGFKTPLSVTVSGFDTNFNSTTRVEIWDGEFTTKLFDYNNFVRSENVIGTPIDESKTKGTFKITDNFFNSNGDYIVRLITDLSADRKEISRAKLTISMPMLVAVSNQSVYVSENGDNWIKRSSFAPFPSFSNLNDVIYVKGEYLTVGNSSFLRVKDFEPWDNLYSSVSGMSGITYSEGYYYMSTENGSIYQSVNGNTWTPLTLSGTFKFNDIHSTGDGKIVAVGENSIVCIVKNGDGTINQYTTAIAGVEFSSVTSNSVKSDLDGSWTHVFVAVGTGGNVYSSVDGIVWISKYSGGSNLNGVYYAGNSVGYTGAPWLAVGDSGRLFSFDLIGVINDTVISTKNLNGVFVSQKRKFAVGDEGTILVSGDNNSIYTLLDVGSENFEAITGR